MTALRVLAAATVLLLATWPADAHRVGASPNTCVFDPIELTTPLGAAAVAPPAPGDTVQLTYDVDASTVQLKAAAATPRPFSVTTVSGALAIQAVFEANISAAGDLIAPAVAVTFTVGEAATVIPLTLTTALAGETGVMVEGKVIAPDSVVILSAVVPTGALPPPLDSGPSTLRVQCTLLPEAPDVDQFKAVPTLSALRGSVSATSTRLLVTLRAGDQSPLEISGAPILLRLTADGVVLGDFVFENGVVSAGKTMTGETADGQMRLTVKPGRTKPKPSYRLELTGSAPPILVGTTGRVQLSATMVTRDVVARGVRAFRSTAGGLRRR